MEEVVVVSYNMSFMSDKSVQESFASEYAFLSNNKNRDARTYWINAKDLLKKFITEQAKEKKTCIIGLQEMNYTEKGTGTGSDAIDSMLDEVNVANGTNYKQLCRFITVEKKGGNEDLAASIIYDTAKFGDIKNSEIWDNYDNESEQKKPKGRPTLLVVTDANYVFITMHGAQDPKMGRNKTLFDEYMIRENKKKAEKKITDYLNAFGINKANLPMDIFLMSDLNDRYDAIREFNLLGMTIYYRGESPRSCCYNYDSSCTDERYMKEYDPNSDYFINEAHTAHREGRAIKLEGFEKIGDKYYYGTCLDDKSIFNLKKTMPPGEGDTKNYRYKGDKVFGMRPRSDIKIYKGQTVDETSVESDHQMVYATFDYNCFDSDGNYTCGDVFEPTFHLDPAPQNSSQGNYGLAIGRRDTLSKPSVHSTLSTSSVHSTLSRPQYGTIRKRSSGKAGKRSSSTSTRVHKAQQKPPMEEVQKTPSPIKYTLTGGRKRRTRKRSKSTGYKKHKKGARKTRRKRHN